MFQLLNLAFLNFVIYIFKNCWSKCCLRATEESYTFLISFEHILSNSNRIICSDLLIFIIWCLFIDYLLTPCCRVLLEKLTGLQLVKKFPAFHGTRRFITALTSVRHLSLSWASPIQSIYPHPTPWRSILILSTHLCLGLPVVSFPPVSPQIYTH